MEQGEQPDEITSLYGPCRQCRQWDEMKERIRARVLLEKAIHKFEEELGSDKYKPSVGDFFKLMALEKDAEDEEIKEIRVTWVGPKPQSAKSE